MSAADRIKQARETTGTSQEDLAHLIGVSVFTVSRYERGFPISATRLAQIAQALGVLADTLVDEDAS